VNAEQTVSLFIRSTASTERGETETGVVEGGPLATATVVPPPIPNTDTLAATSSTEPAALEPGQSQQYTFTYAVTTPRTGTSIVADLRLSDGSPAAGWTIAAQAGGGDTASGDARVETGEWATLAPGTSFALTVTVTAPADVTADQTVSLWLASTATTERGVEAGVEAVAPLATATVVPPPPAPTAEDLTLTCEPSAVAAAPDGETDVTCTITSISETPVTLNAIDVPARDGWTITSETADIDNAGIAISADQPYAFTLTLSPSCDASAQALDVSTTVIIDGQDVPGPTTSVDVALSPETDVTVPPAVQAQSLDFGAMTWDGTGYGAARSEMTITLGGSGSTCTSSESNWSIQVSSSGMIGASGATIPPNAISYIGPSGDAPAGVAPVAGSLPLSPTGTTIATVSGDIDGETAFGVTFELTPPTDTPPDAYTGSITVTVAAGQ
jgi:hypothetical protein